jgi:hypothetical protein
VADTYWEGADMVNPTRKEWTRNVGACSVDDCDRDAKKRGFCTLHYQRWRKHGSTLVGRPGCGDDVARFWSKVDKGTPDECWHWQGAPTTYGYGELGIGGRAGRNVLAHRFAYELCVGPISPGLEIDHVCHNIDPTCEGDLRCMHRRCVNPAHLEAVTNDENKARARRQRRNRAKV